jgi:methylenetetrahydrofolate dehydrogenase (NADP+)/methenyltetrahydrofolate cyclohydrolase
MPGKILDGRKISAEIREELKERTKKLGKKGIIPGLAGILVGEDPGSASYVRLKEKGSAEVGVSARSVKLPEDVTQEKLLETIESLNRDPKINGIFIQMPLPEHLDEDEAVNAICPDKDVDGFHPMSVGRAWMGQPMFLPATPIGIHEMLLRSGYSNLKGKNAVIVNVDNLVGKPLASIWAQESVGANVTLCYPDTPDLAQYTREGDIVVVSVNKAKFLTADMVKEGVIAIDFGANYVEDPTAKSGQRLVGDIDFDAVKEKAEAITPVPGGVGPMTVTMLLVNTVRAAEMQSGLAK